MKFSKVLLQDYLCTKDGQKIFTFFNNFDSIIKNTPQKFYSFTDSLLDMPLAKDSYFLAYGDQKPDKKIKTIDEFVKVFAIKNKADAEDLQYSIPDISVGLYLFFPEFAFPYLFHSHFYKLKQICDYFDIQIPDLPGRKQHLDRCNYYLELCKIFYEFRKENNLSSVEFCTFLYGFALRFCEEYTLEDLSAPMGIYIVGAAKEDVEARRKLQGNDKFLWQGKEEMQPGDIVLMYDLSPYSRISSVWRAVSPGYDDPFHCYPGKVILGYPVEIPPVSFKELAADPLLGKNGLVKAHMQGVNGRSFSVEEYNAILKIIKKKGGNTAKLPPAPEKSKINTKDIICEHDVELKLLEPFLRKLGYQDKEWVTQMRVRMGRNERLIPDYVLHAVETRNEEKGVFVWEAKYRIVTKKQFADDFGQVRSYARRLGCRGLGLVSLEGIILADEQSEFDRDKSIFYSWNELEKPEIFKKVKLYLTKICPPVKK